jgi:hypothetical protein
MAFLALCFKSGNARADARAFPFVFAPSFSQNLQNLTI